MVVVKRIVLDVLKPHHPNVLEFSTAVANTAKNSRVLLRVVEMDEQTESVELVIEGHALQYDAIVAAIDAMGGSVHSIDEVEVVSEE